MGRPSGRAIMVAIMIITEPIHNEYLVLIIVLQFSDVITYEHNTIITSRAQSKLLFYDNSSVEAERLSTAKKPEDQAAFFEGSF
eukprot:scaffold92625_cov32-Prasinocladus_malaysianus.AAC.1